ncbi:MAG: UDP-N-acetylmuramoyl-L-alanyl-D-glutamate--2,6-diaminopimelate ligase, partial [bacterium]|nr:UDP-N-acetylmuramoyl-L-alanyl-D-glutamate--2,6-diaminopimelate ligase [bacterium]
KGAQSIVTESAPPEKYNHICWIQVKNDRFAFINVAARFYDNIPDRFYTIGVTGTNGKTTITSLVAAILEQQAKTALIGTLGMSCGDITRNTSLTTPEPTDIFEFLTLVNQQGGENLVMEVSSVALRLHRVEDITFSQAIFTTFSGDHLDFHKTMDDYLESKILLFNRLKTDDWAVINIDDPNAYKIIEHLNCKYLTYG